MTQKVDPNEVLATLKAKLGKRAHRNLDIIHDVCGKVHRDRGLKDYSPTTIGRKSAAVGGPKVNTLLSPGGKHFRDLIQAWAESGGTTTAKPTRAAVPVDRVLESIDDPIVRSLVAPYFAELRRVKTELNLLKSTPFAININGGASIEKTPAESGVTDVIAPSALLGQQELSAIEQFLDQRWQRKNGFKPNNYGQLVTAKALPEGYPVTPIALTDAINKLRGGKRVAAT